ncbi:Release factor glutamine methyltransferase [Polaromonas vacuolata]|uniref:Release factor glutamine methyltransferase n=1 Tax=Polaromonas vacuolata TaxID=37448 RepID=A0A6H2H6Y2_9BURK|nr:peptide chain release factor N(5)-glutamine methyltransferase [Polaromonas vacuolata]QJC55256.1 Release factor glutamine methyltransferase [Polaromonas vacuolata]
MPPSLTLMQALDQATAQGLPRLDAQLLLLHTLGRQSHERAWLLAHDDQTLSAAAAQNYADFCQRRADDEPLAYIVGEKEFFGLALLCDARVLVPRPDTETLVEWALDLLAQRNDKSIKIIDLGTGSGAIALALAHSLKAIEVFALDASVDALEVAKANALKLGLSLQFVRSNWLEEITDKFEMIVSNPPYIEDADPHLRALRHEPRQALSAGKDGLDDIRQIIAQAPDCLTPGGWLLLEHGYDQAERVLALLVQRGYEQVQGRKDLAGITRCSGGRWPL